MFHVLAWPVPWNFSKLSNAGCSECPELGFQTLLVPPADDSLENWPVVSTVFLYIQPSVFKGFMLICRAVGFPVTCVTGN